ncbi:MAG: LCP family protein [Anaerolineaceae bacterium]|jgi:LCP family protein required for cell wall assembly|nr:LCP family protein [Anaerolineaceae bacterium]
MIKKRALILFSLMFLLTACNLPGLGSTFNIPSKSQVNWVKYDPNAAPTATPFLPLMQDISTPEPESSETGDGQVVPTESSPQRPEGQVNILVLGSDYRPESGYRTDVFMLLSIYPKEGTASILSFPRDLYVYLPGIGNQRINVAQPFGGFPLSKATLEENFGVTADHYIMTNFQGFKGIINSLGGITVNAGAYLYDHCELPQGDAEKNCTIYAGPNYMNGDTALWYVRSRYSTSDFDRTRRAQEVIFAIFEKLMSLDAITRAPELYNLYLSSVETDLTLADIVPLMPVTSQILSDPSRLRRYAIGLDQVSPYVLPDSGANVLIPNYELIDELIVESAFTP